MLSIRCPSMLYNFKKKLPYFATLISALVVAVIAGFWIEAPRMAYADGGGGAEPSEFRKKSPRAKKTTSVRKRKTRQAKKGQKAHRSVRIARPRQVLVSFTISTTDDAIDEIAARYGLRKIAVDNNSLLNQRVGKFALKRRLSNALIKQLTGETLVTSAQPNFLYGLAASKPVQYTAEILKIPAVHKISKGSGVTIAILDSGVHRKHPALKNVISKQFDAVGKAGIGNTNHGTGIASIIVARGKMTGIAPNSRVLSARVFASDRRGRKPVAETFNLLRGLDWAVAEKSAVINMSFAGPKDNLFQQATTAASNKGTVLVAAVGNQGSRKPVAYPAAYETVLAVTATSIKNRLYRHANRGKQIMLAAPGVNVFVARRTRSYGLMTGTSAAAAHVSASIALVLQQNPAMTPNEAIASLIRVATDLGPKGHDNKFGHGLLNVYGALSH